MQQVNTRETVVEAETLTEAWRPVVAPLAESSQRAEFDWLASWNNDHLVAQRAFAAVREWCYATARGEQRGLVLWSNAAVARKHHDDVVAGRQRSYVDGTLGELSGFGVGKSHLAHAAVQFLSQCFYTDRFGIQNRRKPYFLNAVDMLSFIKDTWNSQGKSVEALYREWTGDALVLDDYGKQYVKGESAGWGAEQFYRLIDRLYQGGQSLLITSNLTPVDMEASLGGASMSRLYELTQGDAGWINMSALPDWRSRGFTERE